MGASIKIQDTDLDITQLECSVCHQSFTGQDKENDNWEVFYDTSGTPTITDINDNGFILSIWIRDIVHKVGACPYNESPE